jgi:acyl carrier protein
VNVREQILTIIASIAPDAPVEQLRDDEDLRDALDIDSMDFLNVLVAIAQQLGVEVPERDYGQVRTLAGLVGYVEARRR